MKQGIIPLWNPYMSCGAPFVANNQSACFYPETWLFMLMAPERAFGWSALLSLIMGGAFMFAFLRVLGLRRSAAVVGTIPFLFCGFLVGWMLLPTVRAVPMWLPLMLLAFEKCLRSLTPRERSTIDDRRSTPFLYAALCALAIGLQFLAGHLHVSLFILIIFGAYVAFRLIQTALAGQRRAALTGLACAAASLFTGALLAMLQLLPVLELVGMNPRKVGQAFEAVKGNAMVPAYLLAALMPDAFGNPVDYNFWGSSLFTSSREYIETVWYMGIPTLLLIVAALIFRRTLTSSPSAGGRGGAAFWAGLWLGGAGLAWGTVLYWLLFHLVPPLRQLPGISRAVLICDFAAAVLAGLGFEALLRKLETGDPAAVRRVTDRTALIIGLIAIVGGVGVWLYTGQFENAMPGLGNYTLLQLIRCLALILATVAAVAVLTWTLPPREGTASALPSRAKGQRGAPKVAPSAAPAILPSSRVAWGKALLIVVLAADLLYFAGHFLPATPARYLYV
ncbi:MAG: hypothetical protein WCP21_24340, partial [Armatimonadota bacterium]